MSIPKNIVDSSFAKRQFLSAFLLVAATEYSERGMANDPESMNMILAEIFAKATIVALETAGRS